MKKLFSIALCLCLTLAAVFVVAPKATKVDADSAAAQTLLDKFNQDVYIKNTSFHAAFSGVTTGDENKGNFWGSANQLQRRTIYTPGRLYMSKDDGTVNGGYKNVGEDMVRFHIVDGEEKPDFTVKGAQIETFFTNLDTFTGLEWTAVEDVAGHYRTAYTQAWRDFVAPMWVGSSDVVNLTHVIMHATDTVLYLELYGQTNTIGNTLFSVAEITLPAAEPVAEETTVTTNIANYADDNSWINSTAYSTVKMDNNITVTAVRTTGNYNTGKYYTNGENWRIYQNEEPTITFKAVEGFIIKSVKVTYKAGNTGVLTYNDVGVSSDTVKELGVNTAVFSVGNTGSATNGNIQITDIEVVYEVELTGGCEHKVSTETVDSACGVAGYIKTTCNVCGETNIDTIPAKTHNYEDVAVIEQPTCTQSGSKTQKCTLCGDEKTATITKLGHTKGELIVDTEPSCTEAGVGHYDCTVCHETIESNVVIAARGHDFVDGVCSVCGEKEVVNTTKEVTISFANNSQRTSYSTSKQVWSNNGVTLTNNKASAQSNVADAVSPVKFYAGSQVIIEATGIEKIVFNCNSTSYATALKNSIGTTATVTVNSKVVTVTFATPVDSFTIAKLTAQVRVDSMVVTCAE